MYEENLDTSREYKIDYGYYVRLLSAKIDQIVGIVKRDICHELNMSKFGDTIYKKFLAITPPQLVHFLATNYTVDMTPYRFFEKR